MLRGHVVGVVVAGALLLAAGAEADTITHHSFPSQTLGRDYVYDIYLPTATRARR